MVTLCSCASPAIWHCTTQEVSQSDRLVRLTVHIERQAMPEADSETIASPTILLRRGEAASMRIERDGYTIRVEVPKDSGTEDLRVTVNGASIPITRTHPEPLQDPIHKDSGQSG